MALKVDSTAEERAKGNIYKPFASYREYKETVLLMAWELNEMVEGIPAPMIADYWIITPLFRDRFKRMVKAAHFIHCEHDVQKMLSWCNVDIEKYAAQFDDANRNVSHCTTP